MKKTIAKVSDETLRIEAFLASKPPGEKISYLEIEHDSGVTMDPEGKAKVRSALKRLKKEYSPIRGYGIQIADAGLVIPLLGSKVVKIDRAVKRADRTHRNLQVQFFESLTIEEQRQVLFLGAVFGAVRIAAENGRLFFKDSKKSCGGVAIPLPQI